MENEKENGRIGCGATNDRTKIIDPNDFNGFNSSTNMSVPLEDLNISVVLKTKKKPRTVLITTEKGSTASSSKEVKINFVNGSWIEGANGKKLSLTTKYTDLTTVFEKGIVNNETLGITNIDIDFNSSYAPQITINFIDVRGSSIFQNEGEIAGDNSPNPYSTFFQIPYPIFELEIKGYYGKPVTYCLHMIKFNSKFNSQTGNFEMQCEFVGYTYAMLSDLLVGYLKVIDKTEIGHKKYELYNGNKDLTKTQPVITLLDLVIKLQTLNEGLDKEASDSPNAVGNVNASTALDCLSNIEATINQFAMELTDNKLKKADVEIKLFKFIPIATNEVLSENATKTYKESIHKFVDEFNKLNLGISLNETDFTEISIVGVNKGLYSNVTLEWFDKNVLTFDTKLSSKAGKPDNLVKFKDDIYRFLTTNFELGTTEFHLYNMTAYFNQLSEKKAALEIKKEDYKKSLALELADKVTQSLTFSPTVRNIVEIYTAAAEVFLETIYEVSTSAEKKDNDKRVAQLKSKFQFLENTDLPSIKENSTFYAWPAYKEKDTNGVFVEKYLGDPSVGLEHPEDVDELKFIDDLFNAFIKAAQAEAAAQRDLDSESKLWLPVNPLDTKLFVPTDPYSRIDSSNYLNIVRLALIRGMTFLGYTNDGTTLTDKEIIAMAEAEADNILRSVETKPLQLYIKQISDVNTASSGTTPTKTYSKSLDVYINATGIINGYERKVIIDSQGNEGYFYNYIQELRLPQLMQTLNKNNDFDFTKHESTADITRSREHIYQSVIPINDRFNQAEWPTNYDELLNLHNNENLIFLTNYSSISVLPYVKVDDGGVYIKIFNASEVKQITDEIILNELPQNATTESIILQDQLALPRAELSTKLQSAGFNVLGGPMGIQEYSKLKYGTGDIKLMDVFYADVYEQNQTGLSNSRNKTLTIKYKDKTFKYDNRTVLNERKFGTQMNYYKTSDSDTARNLHGSHGKNRTLLNDTENVNNLFANICYPYIEQPIFDYNRGKVTGEIRKPFDSSSFSLFGSKLYYAQSFSKYPDYAKAFLFLNNLPFNRGLKTGSPFEPNEIINLFNMRGGLIHAPMLWCAWIGSILWRKDFNPDIQENGRIVGGGSGPATGTTNKGSGDPIVWVFNGETFNAGDDYDVTDDDGKQVASYYSHPNRNQYLTCVNVNAPHWPAKFKNIDKTDILLNLPIQVVKEFKRIFFDFVKSSSGLSVWDTLKENLEIWSGTRAGFNDYVDSFNRKVKTSVENGTYNYSEPETTFLKNKDKYIIMSPIVPAEGLYRFNDYLFLELAKNGFDNPAVNALITAMTNEVVIVNNGYEIWMNPYDEKGKRTGEKHKPVYAKKENFYLYFKSLNNKLASSNRALGETEEKKEIVNDIFGTTNENIIKLNLYKHCKNIYDKWIGGTTDPAEIMFKCGVNKRNNSDKGLALKYGNKNSKFIDSFRFVNRTFKDIGDLLYINPIPINDYLTENQNASVYDSVSSILASNNFDFIALPTFINFRDDEELKAIFKPYGNYGQAIKEGSCGPTFVCVYTGEKSKHLAIQDSEYPNDGFDLRCAKSPTTATDIENANKQKGGSLINKVPNDFLSNLNQFEDPVGVFTVKYSQQNQNIFKDISLDQSEFTETEESIKIMDDISQKGAETNRSMAGQNLYGVYSVRSYKAEVEMMGNAMIQPMMYFQLDNIPMFHGAYMVTRVRHSIKPNFMSTNFTGVRIKYSETPLITASDVYMSLIDTMDLSAAVDSGAGNIRGNGLSASDMANLKSIKCHAITKTVIAFIDVLKDVVGYLEGNYCKGGTACGDKPNKIKSGETLWGLDRKNHNKNGKNALDNAFWAKADTYNKGKWGFSYPTPYTQETQPLFALYSPIFEKEYKAFAKRYYTNQSVRALVESDGRLYFNLVYAVYNGEAYFKGMVKLMESEYAQGKKTADLLLQVVINDRVSGLQKSFYNGTNTNLGQDGITKLARTGVKIEKLVGLSSTCK